MNISPFLTVNHSCDETLGWATDRLSQAGLHAVRTFDLHTARLALHDCPCPNHGTNECDCQMVVVLVYREAGDVSMLPTAVSTSPETLILHGNDGQTWLSLAEGPGHRSDSKLSAEIKQALERAPVSISQAG